MQHCDVHLPQLGDTIANWANLMQHACMSMKGMHVP